MTASDTPADCRPRHWAAPIPSALRPEFEAYVRQHYRSFLLTINLISIAAYYSYALADAVLIPDMAKASLVVRSILIAIGLCHIFLVFRYSRSILLMDQLMPMQDIIATLAWFELLKRSHSPDVPTFLYASLIFIVLGNLGVRVSFKGALACSLAISAAILANVALLHQHDPKAVLVFALVYLPVLFFSLFISWTNTVSVRRAFLADVEQRRQQAELSALNQRLQALATTDALTGVGNRRAFDLQLAESWSLRQQGKGFALLLVDIDYFKPFNDYYGHLAGDHCLAEVARTMDNTLQSRQARTFRYGGEEFAVLLQVSRLDELNSITELLVRQVSNLNIEHLNRKDGPHCVTISVGAALSTTEGLQHATDLLTCCDRLLYQAKQQGRNQACLAAMAIA